ncbi:unnamed protein product [Brachionus calyciflorus]|uniref:BHLH domain-containing protein n=1 Tax=Brachionus calyciflorus TaxID=104777 RepID=A0A813ZF72_9BILA|nr:unnamed protein product [Brachionus calyciflorus]
MNNLNLNSPSNIASSGVQPCSSNSLQAHSQLPRKAYFLNKYEQLNNPQIKPQVVSNSDLMPASSSKSKDTMNSSNHQIASKRHFSGSNSSLQNSDDEDDDFIESSLDLSQADLANKSKEEKRRLSHTAAEQKRRNAIKRGYDELQYIVPSCEFMDPSSSQKVCKATVLKRCFELLQNVLPYCQQIDPIISTRITRATTLEQTIDYIHELEKDKDKHEHDLDSLKKEIMALRIMKSNYEEMLQYHRNTPKDNSVEINDETKFDLFVKFSENLFNSFQSMINPNSFGELSASMFNWLEQMCTASSLKNFILLSLYQATQQIFH